MLTDGKWVYTPKRVPSPSKPHRPHGPIRRFFFSKHENAHHHETYPWYKVIWLTGVDYFSTLGYQPAIALAAAGMLSPIATVLLVLVTLLGAVPTYFEVAKRSFTGQGSIAMLENLLRGWWGKIFVLLLLGFATTDFVITITLSAADATAHILENPQFGKFIPHSKVGLTLTLILALATVFLLGFSEAIGTAMLVAVPFLALNAIALGRCLWDIWQDFDLFSNWWRHHIWNASWKDVFVVSLVIFPKLALGLSGFETGVSVMPLVKDETDIGAPKEVAGASVLLKRIAGTHKLLLVSAVIMSIYLMISSICSTLLIERSLVLKGGEANGRAISYLAHLYFGSVFGTAYDISTVLILWFAGASAMAGLLNLLPRYLPRFGMAPAWVQQSRPLIVLITLTCILVTFAFHADVDAQAGAYATGVLVLILSAACAVALALAKEHKQSGQRNLCKKSLYFWIVAGVFLFTLIDNVIERPDGLLISLCFILGILIVGAVSRWFRAYELRVASHTFTDLESEELWLRLRGKKISLVPISAIDGNWRVRKEAMIRNYYNLKDPLAFLTIQLRDDRSEFSAPLKISIREEKSPDEHLSYIIEVTGAVAIANTIAYLSEQLDPIAIYLGLARKNAMEQAISYLLFGEGEVGIITYKVLVHYWESTPEDDIRPVLFLMSE